MVNLKKSDDITIGDVEELAMILYKDIGTAISKLVTASDNYGFYSRSYVRAYASWIEGKIWLYKEVMRRIEGKWHTDLPTASQLYLFEYDWYVDSSGTARLKQKRLGAKENLKGFFVLMSQLFSDYDVDFGGEGWQSVMSFYMTRDKIMHPSGDTNLDIDKQEVLSFDKGRVWLDGEFEKINKLISDRLKIH